MRGERAKKTEEEFRPVQLVTGQGPVGVGAGVCLNYSCRQNLRFACVANLGSDNVSAYSIDGTTGALMSIPGSAFPAGRLLSRRSLSLGPKSHLSLLKSRSRHKKDRDSSLMTPRENVLEAEATLRVRVGGSAISTLCIAKCHVCVGEGSAG